MSQQIASGFPDKAAAPGFFSAPDAAPAPFSVLKPRPPLAEQQAMSRVQQMLAPPSHGRRKLWEFDGTLHCSIVGTCLSNAELRHALGKLGLKETDTASEHDVHASGVLLAGKRHDGAKLLQKALDRRHRVAINQFAHAKSPNEVRGLWQEAVRRGEIPGAYWAALTHPATTNVLVREIFAEMHMLSHLVGAANRADIRQLRRLEAENAELQAKVQRQQQQLRDAIVARDATIRKLGWALEDSVAHNRYVELSEASAAGSAAWTQLAADLKNRLARSETSRERIAQQLADARLALSKERDARSAGEQREIALRDEIEALESGLALDATMADEAANHPPVTLTFLYVGGRPPQIGHLRAAAERRGGVFLHHDGGIEERDGLLPGLVSRADAVLFPTDCVSHAAMLRVKRLCRQAGKPFVPLRSGGVGSFCAALRRVALAGAED